MVDDKTVLEWNHHIMHHNNNNYGSGPHFFVLMGAKPSAEGMGDTNTTSARYKDITSLQRF